MALSQNIVQQNLNQKKQIIHEYEAIQEVIQDYPELTYLVKSVTDFKIENEEFSQVFPEFQQKYHGRNIDPAKSGFDSNGNVFQYDEDGVKHTYVGTRGKTPSYKGWCGANSANETNALGYNKDGKLIYPQDHNGVFVSFCILHDIGYDERGFCSYSDDLTFCARVSNNYDRMTYSEALLARSACLYFTTIGAVLSKLKTKALGTDPARTLYNVNADDIYYRLVKNQDPYSRRRFYMGVENGLESTIIQQTQPVHNRYITNNLLMDFYRIGVESMAG
jgi:hypothetical protein